MRREIEEMRDRRDEKMQRSYGFLTPALNLFLVFTVM